MNSFLERYCWGYDVFKLFFELVFFLLVGEEFNFVFFVELCSIKLCELLGLFVFFFDEMFLLE